MAAIKKLDPEFRKLLLQLTMEYLTKEPCDFVEFSIQFLKEKRMKQTNEEQLKKDSLIQDSSEEDLLDDQFLRKRAIFDETFDDLEEFSVNVIPKSDELKERLKAQIREIIVFRTIPEKDLNYLIDIMQKKNVRKGDKLIREGDEGDYFYVIESGLFTAFKKDNMQDTILKIYENEGYFGELALLYNVPRYASVQADTDGVVWSIDRKNFQRIVVKSAMERRDKYKQLMKNVPILSSLSEVELSDLIDCLEFQVFKSKDRIVKQGEKGDGMYFIMNGTLRVTVKPPQGLKEIEIKKLTSGEYFGELALLTQKPRAASVYAVDDVEVAYLNREAFERLLGPCSDIMKRNIAQYDEQLKTLIHVD